MNRLKGLFGASGATYREIDRLADRTEGHFQALVTGTIPNPTQKILTAYARVFGCSVGYLLAGEGEPPAREQVAAAIERARAARIIPAHTASDFNVADDPRPSQAA
jgi:hypothetical protein